MGDENQVQSDDAYLFLCIILQVLETADEVTMCLFTLALQFFQPAFESLRFQVLGQQLCIKLNKHYKQN